MNHLALLCGCWAGQYHVDSDAAIVGFMRPVAIGPQQDFLTSVRISR
jgi:hypothetical protein